jgi:glycosyltransferase involved in cell wall biosynthesis
VDHGDRLIRVLLAITRLELGGAQRVVLQTAALLDRKRFAVALAWGPGDYLDHEAHEIHSLARYPIPNLVRPVAPWSDLRALASLRRAIRDFGPDVIHTHSSKAGILGRLAARLERVPAVVHTVHGFGFTPLQAAPKRLLFKSVERLAARGTDHFVMVSETDLDRGVEIGLFPRERATVIRAAIEIERFRSIGSGGEVHDRLGLPPGAPVVTQIGNFKPQKAPLDFVKMAAAVHRRFPQTQFVMVGDGPLKVEAERLAHSLGLVEAMTFCGWWDDIPGLLAATDVSVLTSRHEGLPCSVVESLAAGVPVVATAVDGTVEVVRPGVNGFLAPAGDIRALADHVCAILEKPELKRQLAAAAPEHLEDFDVSVMVRQQEDLYRCIGPMSHS